MFSRIVKALTPSFLQQYSADKSDEEDIFYDSYTELDSDIYIKKKLFNPTDPAPDQLSMSNNNTEVSTHQTPPDIDAHQFTPAQTITESSGVDMPNTPVSENLVVHTNPSRPMVDLNHHPVVNENHYPMMNTSYHSMVDTNPQHSIVHMNSPHPMMHTNSPNPMMHTNSPNTMMHTNYPQPMAIVNPQYPVGYPNCQNSLMHPNYQNAMMYPNIQYSVAYPTTLGPRFVSPTQVISSPQNMVSPSDVMAGSQRFVSPTQVISGPQDIVSTDGAQQQSESVPAAPLGLFSSGQVPPNTMVMDPQNHAPRDQTHMEKSHTCTQNALPKFTIKYNGTGEWSDFLFQFNVWATTNNWSDNQKALYLCLSLEGKALKVAVSLPADVRSDFHSLVDGLTTYFDPPSRIASSTTLFETRIRKKNESPMQFALELKRLAAKAKPHWNLKDNHVKETLVDRFLWNLGDEFMAAYVRRQKPQGLDEAALEAENYLESFQYVSHQVAPVQTLPQETPEPQTVRHVTPNINRGNFHRGGGYRGGSTNRFGSNRPSFVPRGGSANQRGFTRGAAGRGGFRGGGRGGQFSSPRASATSPRFQSQPTTTQTQPSILESQTQPSIPQSQPPSPQTN